MRRKASGRKASDGCARVLAVLLAVSGCDILDPPAPDPGDVFDGPLPGLTAAERAAFIRGDKAFGRAFSPAEGLGPIFNNVSCASCHSGDGRGRPSNALIRFSVSGEQVPELGGPQLQTKAIPGAVPEQLPPGAQVSVRLPPPVFGVGLIEAIPVASILAHADPDDADGDGISGRPHWVVPAAYVPGRDTGAGGSSGDPVPELGRFGRKAQVSTLFEQVVEAYHQDMGITSDFLPVENTNPLASHAEAADRVPDPEVSESEVRAVLAYIRTLAQPAPGAMTPMREVGALLFEQVGCASCHVPQLRTGPSTVAAIADTPVWLYSDLLLHDMGDELADHRPDGQANGREWRTAPLWGLRIMRDFLDGDAFLLHDGRARSIEEAIGFHGGEGSRARTAFGNLSPEARRALIDFVGSR